MTCTCGQDPHLQACEIEREQRARSDAKLRRVIRAMEDRAAGRHRWRGMADAARWACRWEASRNSPRSISLGKNSSGPPSVQAIEATDLGISMFWKAEEAAIVDDRERNPQKPAPLKEWRWGAFHGAGRVRAYSDAQLAEKTPGWTDAEVTTRMKRYMRVGTDFLREHGMLNGGPDEDGA